MTLTVHLLREILNTDQYSSLEIMDLLESSSVFFTHPELADEILRMNDQHLDCVHSKVLEILSAYTVQRNDYLQFLLSMLDGDRSRQVAGEILSVIACNDEFGEQLFASLLVLSSNVTDLVSLEDFISFKSSSSNQLLFKALNVCINRGIAELLMIDDAFWITIIRCLIFKNVGCDKLILSVMHRILSYNFETSHDHSQYVVNTRLMLEFIDTANSIKQCSTPMLKEHVPQIMNFAKRVKDRDFHAYWMFVLFDLLSEHYNEAVLKLAVKVVCSIDNLGLEFLSDSIETDFILRKFMDASSNQLMFEFPSLGRDIIRLIRSILSCGTPTITLQLLRSCLKFSGNYHYKLHLCIALQNLPPSQRISFSECISECSSFLSSLKCVADPTKSAILIASFRCFINFFDWRNSDVADFLRLFSLYSRFNLLNNVYLRNASVELEGIIPDIYGLPSIVLSDISLSNLRALSCSIDIISYFASKQMINCDLPLIYRAFLGDLKPSEVYEVLNSIIDLIPEEKTPSLDEDDLLYTEKMLTRLVDILCRMDTDATVMALEACLVEIQISITKHPTERYLAIRRSIVEVLLSRFQLPLPSTLSESLQLYLGDERMRPDTYSQYLKSLNLRLFLEYSGYSLTDELLENTFLLCLRIFELENTDQCALAFSVMSKFSYKLHQSGFLVREKFNETVALMYSSLDGSHNSTGSPEYSQCLKEFLNFLLNESTICETEEKENKLVEIVGVYVEKMLVDLKPNWIVYLSSYSSLTFKQVMGNKKRLSSSCIPWAANLMIMYDIDDSVRLDEDIINDLEDYFVVLPASIRTDKSSVRDIKSNFLQAFSFAGTDFAVSHLEHFLDLDWRLLESVSFKRQHVNSNCYIRRLRIWLYVSTLSSVLRSSTVEGAKKEELLLRITGRLVNENCDPSLRVLIEMTIANLLTHKFVDSILSSGLDEKPSTYTCSVLHSIGLFYLIFADENSLLILHNEATQLFLNWSTATHNNICLSAQVFLIRIEAKLRNLEIPPESFSHVSHLVSFWENHKKFKPFLEKHTVGSLYYHFLEDSLLEAIKDGNIISMIHDEIVSRFEVISSESLGNKNSVRNDSTKRDKSIIDVFDDLSIAKTTNQLKVVPDAHLLNGVAVGGDVSRSRDCALIVVASLVDRMSNLGGICRTSEVCGVSKLVVNSLKSIQSSSEFSNVSVTAEKWLHIEEVKIEAVLAYLLLLRKRGFTVVALEQSNRSVALQKYTFPQKCVVVLGSEKYGVPADILEACQVHVQIPQLGIIRSLNVHVACSLLIWQYNQQHRLA